MARNSACQQGDDLHLIEWLLFRFARRLRAFRRAWSLHERLVCVCRVETLEEIFRQRRIDAPLLDGPGTGLIPEPGPHQALHLLLCEGFLLHPCWQRNNHRYKDIYIEKPLTQTIHDGHLVVQAVRKYKRRSAIT